jgi:hypothetical protein
MPDRDWTGASLEKALRSGELDRPALELVGMVKSAESAGKISFTPTDCESWVDIPTDLIEKAEQVGQRSCRDHIHPVFRLTLKKPEDPEAQILAALLMSSGTVAPQVVVSPQMGNSGASILPAAISNSSPATGGVTVAPGATTFSPRLALGCTECIRETYVGNNNWWGNRTCAYLVCTPIGGVNQCQLYTTSEPCQTNTWQQILTW